ncbi:phosphate-selective porin OprO/OprP [Methylohalomonas lacus]|uniref:Phosphate-selective porin OprO/OprP n=1 Tax=Methylohalomonas lacus TaxID=398773 RepID=A0AAE3L1Q9_9GAMM|nr:porin [Methylohalomonas lacus]MCS3903970.1 phosphate-selective porin OprO/OprP [Methylohalomonas lacus]
MTRTKLNVLCGSALLGGLSLLTVPAHADEATMEILEILRSKGDISQEKYEELKAKSEKADSEKVKITTKEKFAVKSADGNWEWGIGGRIMADYAIYDNDTDSSGMEVPGLSDGHELRRARLNMSGKFYDVWGMKLQVDFAGGAEIKDAYIDYSGFENFKVKVGNFKEPFSLEELTSSKYITFMQRSTPVNAFAPSRNLGIAGYTSFADQVTLSGGVFGDGIESGSGDDGTSYGVTGRVTFSPIHEAGRVVHLGAAVSQRNTNSNNTVRFRDRFETHVSGTRLVDTADLTNTDDVTRYGLEAAGVWDRLSLQGEYIMADVNRDNGFEDADFDGFYLTGSFFLTDDHRPYDFGPGDFDKVSPSTTVGKGGIGAWEVAARYSSLDLNDGALNGGKQDLLTVGLNWYATKNIRFMANYNQVLDLKGGAFDGAEPAAFQARAQVFW